MQGNLLLTELFSFAHNVYGIAKPVIIIQLIIFLLLPSLLERSRDPWALGTAVFCYVMEAVGVLLMTMGALPTIMAVLSGQNFSPEVYLGLLLVFATGGILYLWIDQTLRSMSDSVKLVPSIIYHFTIKTIAYLAVIFSALSFSMAITTGSTSARGWWIIPTVTLIYGAVLCGMTATKSSAPLSISTAAVTKPAAAKRPAKRKKK